MNLDFSEEQTMLRNSVRALCERHCDSTVVRAMERDQAGYSDTFWRALAEAGLCGLSVGVTYGGAGLGSLERAIVMQELGRALAPSPYFVSCIMAASLLERSGSEAQRNEWLPAIASGRKIVVPAWREPERGESFASVEMEAVERRGHLLLRGTKCLVPFAHRADALLVLFRRDGALRSAMVPCAGLAVEPQPNHADQSVFQVRFEDVELTVDACLAAADTGAVWDQVMLDCQIGLAAQAVGGAERMLEMSVDYARERQQFGQPIGAFQAIAHYLADRATELEGARYQVYQAAWNRDAREPDTRLALMAKYQATRVFRQISATGVQVHGGMGFSAEADPQLFYRRAKYQQLSNWSPAYLEQRIAGEVLR